MQDLTPLLRIVDADSSHRDFVRVLSAEVFARFGDYETMLPGLLQLPWIRTSIAEIAGEAVGFAMISLEDLAIGDVDLVAIAVDKKRHSRGVGRTLLAHVEAEACRLARGRTAVVRLTVAKDNARALDLFRRSGYIADGESAGSYPRGQPSLEMRKTIKKPGQIYF